MGDAAGIGPEIVLKSLADKDTLEICRPVIIGDAQVLRRTARDLNLDLEFVTVKRDGEIPAGAGKIIIYDLANISGEIRYGEDSAVLEFSASLDGLTIHGVDMLTWGPDGRLTDFTVMVRPFKGLTKLMEHMAAELGG